MRFLYIEDCIDNHFLIDFYLKSMNIELVCVETVEAGLEQLEHQHFDALLLDLNLPGSLTSWNLLEKLKKNNLLGTLKIWVISAMQNNEVLPRIAEFKGVEFIRKPIKRAEFIQLIKQAFPKH